MIKKKHPSLSVNILTNYPKGKNKVIALFLQGKNKSCIHAQVKGFLSSDSLSHDNHKTLFPGGLSPTNRDVLDAVP